MLLKYRTFASLVLDGLGSLMTCKAFLPAWQDMELATPSTEEPVTQIAGDVPVEPLPLQADATQLEMDLQAYERPLAVTPFGTPELVPDWQDSHAMRAYVSPSSLGQWVRTDLGVRTFQGLGKNAPKREQVVRRLTRDVHTQQILESLPCEIHLQVPGAIASTLSSWLWSPYTSAQPVTFRPRLSIVSNPCRFLLLLSPEELSPAPFPSGRGGGGFLVPCLRPFVSPSLFVVVAGSPIFAIFYSWCL